MLQSSFSPSIPKRDLDTRKTAPNIEVSPENPKAISKYLLGYIERGLSSACALRLPKSVHSYALVKT